MTELETQYWDEEAKLIKIAHRCYTYKQHLCANLNEFPEVQEEVAKIQRRQLELMIAINRERCRNSPKQPTVDYLSGEWK